MKFLNHNLFTGDITVNGTTTLSTATGITRTTGDNSTHLATTAFVKAQDYATNTSLGNYVPVSRTLTINGVTFDLSANRAWTIGTSDYTSTLKHIVKAGVAITKGQAVYVTSADGTNMIVGLASNTTEATSSKTMGLIDTTVAANGFTSVITEGLLAGLNTVGATAGDPVWLGTGGNLIYGLLNKPYAPAHLVFIGIVTRVNANNGEIFVKVQNGFELKEIHDVDLITTAPINGHLLGYNGTLWVNKTIAGWLGYTPANASGTTNYLSKFTGSTTLGNSLVYDNGTNVGIGTTDPTSQMSGTFGIGIYNALYPAVGFKNSTTAWLWYGQNSTFKMWNATAGDILTANTSGNIGIGTTSPSDKLDVNGNARATRYSNVGFLGTGQNNARNHFTPLAAGTASPGTGWIAGAFGDATADRIVIGQWTNGAQQAIFGAHNANLDSWADTNYVSINHKFYANGDWASAPSVTFTSTGLVGIGTTAPLNLLHVSQAAANTIFRLGNNASYDQFIYFNGGNDWSLGMDYSNSNAFVLSNSSSIGTNDRIVVTTAGNVGIGTTSPQSKLQIGTTNFAITGRTSAVYGAASETIFTVGVTGVDYPQLLNFGVDQTGLYSTISARQFTVASENKLILQPNGGNVGIGTTSPSNKLQVANGDMSITTGYSFILADTDTNWRLGRNIISETGNQLTSNTMQFIAANASDQGWQFVDDDGNTRFEIGASTGNAWLPSGNLYLNGNLAATQSWVTSQGYLTSYTETDTLASVTGRGASTATNSVFTGGLQARKNQTDNNYTTAALWTESFGNTTTGIAFHISGNVGKFLEMRTNGVLYWDNAQVWTASTLTNLNQLTNGPGYITSYTETDTLQSVTSRGSSTNTDIRIKRPSNKVDNASCTELPSRVEFNNAFASGQSGYMIFRYPTYNNFLISGDYDGNIGGAIPNIQFGRQSTVYMHINSSDGNIGIGTATPSEKFHVIGRGIFDGGSGNSSTDAVLYVTKSTNDDWGLYVNNAGLDYGIYARMSPSANYAIAIHNGTTWTTRITGNAVIYLGEKNAIEGNYDSWLRLNNSSQYASGVYTPGVMRADGGFNVSGSTVWHAGNDGAGSGLDADLLDGYNHSNFIGLNGNSYFQLTTWLQSTGNHGFYSPSSGAGTHFYPQVTAYGSFRIEGGANSFLGIELFTLTRKPTWMWDNNGGGMYSQSDNAWYYYYSHSTGRLHIGASSGNAVWHSGDFTSTNISNWNTAYGWGNHASQGYATQTYVNTAISNLVDAAPATLDTLNELAAALGDDPNFATTVATSIGNKVAKAGDTMTGNLNWGATNLGLTWDMNTDGAYIKFFNTGNGDTDSRLEYGTSDDGNEYHRWVISNVERMNLKTAGLTVTGNVTCTGTFTETSSRRFKENIVDLEPTSEKVEKLRPVQYNKVDNDATEIGLIAEEVAELFPELVTYNEDGQPSGVQYQRLSVILLKTIQEQNVALAALTERINKLENK
jgi:hypothetical protein